MAHLLFDLQTGVSGDMILAALFDLGLDFTAWRERMQGLGLPEIGLHRRKVVKQGLSATAFSVEAPVETRHRRLSDIRRLIEASSLPEQVKGDAMRVFTRLGRAEAEVHGTSIEDVHFHEVGALDSLVDILGACLGFSMLGITSFETTPFPVGFGQVKTAHGIMSEPVPAVVSLTRGFPVRRIDLAGELCTPTGAALVTTFAGPWRPGALFQAERVGYGAGTRDYPDRANVLRLLLGRREAEGRRTWSAEGGAGNADPFPGGEEVYQVECNLDDMPPYLLSHAAARLLKAGCLDVWQEPIVMKKGRSAVKLAALVPAAGLETALRLIARETTAGGMRFHRVERFIAAKASGEIGTRFGAIATKVIDFGSLGRREAPEFDSLRAAAETKGLPLLEVYRESLRALETARPAPGAEASAGPALPPRFRPLRQGSARRIFP